MSPSVSVVVRAAAAGGRFPDRDSVADGDLLPADEDVFDQKPQDPPAFFGAGGLGAGAELGEKAFQVADELEVGVPVGVVLQGPSG